MEDNLDLNFEEPEEVDQEEGTLQDTAQQS